MKYLLLPLFLFMMPLEAVERASVCKTLPTYFRYSSDECQEIAEKKSELHMCMQEVLAWDKVIDSLALTKKANLYRVRAYLYTAQRDAAFLSINNHQDCMGSLDPISYEVVKLFFPNIEPQEVTDSYSQLLADVVMAKIKTRFTEEEAGIKEFPAKESDPRLKDFPRPLTGLHRASWKPWLLKDPTKIVLTPPPNDHQYWKKQSELVKEELEQSTPEQQEIVLFWEGKSGPGSGSWLAITDQYMLQTSVPFPKFLFIRSVLAQAGIDCDIAVYFQKYTYAMPRPWMVNKEIIPCVPLPNHPSYPSTHATYSAMYATLLSYYFPSQEDLWFRKARDAALSRVWGGLHFPIDTWEGRKFGIQMGNEILQQVRNRCF
jgi:hypothetical protein